MMDATIWTSYTYVNFTRHTEKIAEYYIAHIVYNIIQLYYMSFHQLLRPETALKIEEIWINHMYFIYVFL